MHPPAPWLFLASACLAGPLRAAPAGTNLGFESNLGGWTTSGVSINSTKPFAGSKCLALQTGFIQQTFTGLQPGTPHVVSFAYRSNRGADYLLSHARVLVDGAVIGEIHNGLHSEYLDREGFEFIPAATSAILRIESSGPGPDGFLLDSIKMVTGGLPAPPEHPWTGLTVKTDARGGRQLANGGFESAIADPSSSQDVTGDPSNPHVCDFALPGWFVTRENVDVIGGTASPPEGNRVLDTSGNGPGGIAQTITGLQPGQVYTLSFLYACHAFWGAQDMTGEVHANGRRVASLVRTYAQNWSAGYELKEIPALASAAGRLTVEIRSTITDKGGCIVYDDFRLKPGGDGFLAWSLLHGVTPRQDADDDRDGLTQGFEFLFGTDPAIPDSQPVPARGILSVPLSGLALSQGYTHQLQTSRTLSTWQNATAPGGGMTLIADTISPGTDGLRVYAIDPEEPLLFWRHQMTLP